MASIGDLLSKSGGTALRAISSFNPTLGGKAAKYVDWAGDQYAKVGISLPEYGATEQVESTGGRTSQIAAEASGDTAKLAELEKKAVDRAGFYSATGVTANKAAQSTQPSTSYSQDPNTVSELKSERAQGASVGDIRNFGGKDWRWDGESWAPEGGGSVGGASTRQPTSAGDVYSKIPTDTGLTGQDLEDLKAFVKNAQEGQIKSADDLAREFLASKREQSGREYDTIMDALGVQKGEIKTLAGEQKGFARGEAKLAGEEFTAREAKEKGDVEKERTSFEKEVEEKKDLLANSWRTLSKELQAVMRGRGIQDSSYAAGREGKLLMEFNKGLRQIAVKSTEALGEFSDAVIEIGSYYTRQQNQMDFQLNKQLANIDTFVRQQTQSIQAQENVALSNKLNQIRQAVTDGQTLKTQVTMKVADQKVNFAMWMYQTQQNYKLAVAQAAQGNVASARQSINDTRNTFKLIGDVLDYGGQFVQSTAADGTLTTFVHGTNPATGEPVQLEVSAGFAETKALESAAGRAESYSAIRDSGYTYDPTTEGLSAIESQPGTLSKIGSWLNVFD